MGLPVCVGVVCICPKSCMQYVPRSDTPGHVTTAALHGGLWAISSTQAWPNHPMIPIFPRSDSLASPFNVFISSGAPDVGRAQLLGMPQHKASATMAGSLVVYVLRYSSVSAEIPILYAHTVHTCCTVRVYDHTMHSERNPLTFAVRLDPKRQTLSVQ